MYINYVIQLVIFCGVPIVGFLIFRNMINSIKREAIEEAKSTNKNKRNGNRRKVNIDLTKITKKNQNLNEFIKNIKYIYRTYIIRILQSSIACFLMAVSFVLLPDVIKDLPYVLTGKTINGTGEVIDVTSDYDYETRNSWDDVIVLMENGDEVEIKSNVGEIKIGELFFIEYLPNTLITGKYKKIR